MPYIGGGAYYLDVVGLQGSQLCHTKFTYYTELGAPRPTAYQVVETFADQVIDEWMDLVTPDFSFLEIRYSSAYGMGFGVFPLTGFVGTIVWDTMPPFVTANFYRTVEPAVDQEGAGTTPIKRGRFGISGIPESVGNNGLITDAAWLIQAQVFANQTLTVVDPAGTGVDAHQVVVRFDPGNPNTVPLKIADVVGITCTGFGTQNTRKH